ncbi:MAG: DUF4376 domain-containing protein [Prevotella sp.]|nr:DUF4376 domain-containing protein [Prevotella sp.]
MNEDQNFDLRNALNAERAQLMSNLAANTSSIGDWKLARIQEARLMGAPDPYDLNNLVKQRQIARNRINEIEVELKRLDGIEPTEAELLALAKSKKNGEITEFDNSANVNSFIIGGLPMWLNFDLRSRLMRSLEATEAKGETAMEKSFGGITYSFPTSQWRAMVNAVEGYADQCQRVTEGHRDAVNALTTVKKVEAYDYTQGYPPKINLDTMFAD